MQKNCCGLFDSASRDPNGNTVGFEVTELVSEEAIREKNGVDATHQVYRDWQPPEIVAKIQDIMSQKDQQCYLSMNGRTVLSQTILIIFTDEPGLDYFTCKPTLDQHRFPRLKNLHEAVLLFSYDPRTGTYPFIVLNCERRNTD